MTPAVVVEESPHEEQTSASACPAGRTTLKAGAATVLRSMWFRRTKNFQEQQSLDKSKTKSSLGKAGGRQRAFPRLHSSIRLAMKEIHQVSRGGSGLPVPQPYHTQSPWGMWSLFPQVVLLGHRSYSVVLEWRLFIESAGLGEKLGGGSLRCLKRNT